MIRTGIQGDPSKWEAIIPPLLFLVRESPQASTSYTPFKLVYGHKHHGLLDIICDGWLEQGPGLVVDFRERLEKVRNIAQDNLGRSQAKQKTTYDEHAKERDLKEGEWVLVKLPDNNLKLLAQWQGPFQIKRKLRPVNYEVLRMETVRRKQRYHINLLKRWHQKEDWLMQAEIKSAALDEIGDPAVSEDRKGDPKMGKELQEE